jgi:AraC family transcriptional regulator, transcriptional activator of pobA
LKHSSIIPTLYPEQIRSRYLKSGSGIDIAIGNFNLFFVQSVEGSCRHLRLPTPPHRNTAIECILLTEGTIIRSLGLNTFEVNKNCVFFLPAGQITTIESISTDAKGFYCHFDASVLIRKFIHLHLINEFDFLRSISDPVITLPAKTVLHLVQLFQRLLEENQKGNCEDLIQSYLFTILLEIKQHYHPGHSKSISPAGYLTDRFKELIAANYKTNQRVADYAAILNVTPNHLTKSVKTVTGKSPTQWIDGLIVLEAKVLLYQSRLTISEISQELGIEDPSYFGRMFRKYTGQTPRDFRRQVEGANNERHTG